MQNFKSRTPRDAKYLAYVRTHPCCQCGYTNYVHAHHTTTGGMSLKGSDYETIPLCPVCHHEMDNKRKDQIRNLSTIINRLKANYKGEIHESN